MYVQVLPAAQAVGPVQPCPPHCPYFGDVATLVDVGGEEVVGFAGAEVVAGAELLAGGAALLEGLLPPEEGLMTTPPGPATEVVISPDSMYTPLK